MIEHEDGRRFHFLKMHKKRSAKSCAVGNEFGCAGDMLFTQDADLAQRPLKAMKFMLYGSSFRSVWNHFQCSCLFIVRAHTWAGTAAPRRPRAGARTAGPGRRCHRPPGTIRVTAPTLRRVHSHAHESRSATGTE